MKNKLLSVLIISILFLFFSSNSFSQVGIGTTNPNSDALLEIGDPTSPITKGLLIPRVDLEATNLPAPLSTDIAGMIVYNKATDGSGATEVTPGFYYNDGADWVRISSGASSDYWKITGNTGTIAGTNFLGTTDNISLELFTNNTTRMRLENDGQVSIGFGAAAVNTDHQFNVGSTFTDGTAIGGYSGSAGVGVYGQNTSSGLGVYGLNNSTGQGVRGFNSGTGWGIFGRTTNASGIGLGAQNSSTGTAFITAGNSGALWNFAGSGGILNGIFGVIGLTTSATGTGMAAAGNASTTINTLTSGSGIASSGDTGVYGLSSSSSGTGIIGVGNDNSTIATHSLGSGIAGTGSNIGVFGYAGNGSTSNGNRGNAGGEFVLDSDNDPTTNTGNNGTRARAILAGFNLVNPADSTGTSLGDAESYYGGYFSGGSESNGTPTYAYVGMRYSTDNNGTSGTDYKIIGPGNVSTIIKDAQGASRIMFAPEAPEIIFQDFGVGTLINGEIRIDIDPILKNVIFVDNNHPLKVYVTLEGDCNGIYVTNKSTDGFTVKELNGGTSNVSFSWQIVANRADTKDNTGRTVSKHVGLRLPFGPGPLSSDLKKMETITSTAHKIEVDSIKNKENSYSKKSKGSKLESVISEKKN